MLLHHLHPLMRRCVFHRSPQMISGGICNPCSLCWALYPQFAGIPGYLWVDTNQSTSPTKQYILHMPPNEPTVHTLFSHVFALFEYLPQVMSGTWICLQCTRQQLLTNQIMFPAGISCKQLQQGFIPQS